MAMRHERISLCWTSLEERKILKKFLESIGEEIKPGSHRFASDAYRPKSTHALWFNGNSWQISSSQSLAISINRFLYKYSPTKETHDLGEIVAQFELKIESLLEKYSEKEVLNSQQTGDTARASKYYEGIRFGLIKSMKLLKKEINEADHRNTSTMIMLDTQK